MMSRKPTRAPCAANCRTSASPMPDAPPVINTHRSFQVGIDRRHRLIPLPPLGCRGTNTVPIIVCTVCPSWLRVVVLNRINPRVGFDADGRISSTSTTTCNVSPGRTDLRHRLVEFGLSSTGHEHASAFAREPLALAKPMPLLAPVMTATLPSSLPMFVYRLLTGEIWTGAADEGRTDLKLSVWPSDEHRITPVRPLSGCTKLRYSAR